MVLFPFSLPVPRKGEKKRHHAKRLNSCSLHVFLEVQNSRAIGTLEHPALLIRKALAHPGLFKWITETLKNSGLPTVTL